jgi:hypothetical protein
VSEGRGEGMGTTGLRLPISKKRAGDEKEELRTCLSARVGSGTLDKRVRS